jgi:hypothetical protein
MVLAVAFNLSLRSSCLPWSQWPWAWWSPAGADGWQTGRAARQLLRGVSLAQQVVTLAPVPAMAPTAPIRRPAGHTRRAPKKVTDAPANRPCSAPVSPALLARPSQTAARATGHEAQGRRVDQLDEPPWCPPGVHESGVARRVARRRRLAGMGGREHWLVRMRADAVRAARGWARALPQHGSVAQAPVLECGRGSRRGVESAAWLLSSVKDAARDAVAGSRGLRGLW